MSGVWKDGEARMREAISTAEGGIHLLICQHAWVDRGEICKGVLAVSPELWFPAQEAVHGMGVEKVYWLTSG